MMSGALSEDPGRPRLGAAARTVFRSELNPVDFLYRAAYLYPDKVAATGWQAAVQLLGTGRTVVAVRQRAA
jgi:hypothetical protein